MSTFSTTVRRGLVITAAAAAAGPVVAATASAATPPASVGPTAAAALDAGPVGQIVDPTGATGVNGASQFADTIPVGRTAAAPSLGALPVVGPLAGGLPIAGPAANMAMPVLSGVSGGLPIVGPLVQGLPLVGGMISPAHAALGSSPLTRSRPATAPAALPAATPFHADPNWDASSLLPTTAAPVAAVTGRPNAATTGLSTPLQAPSLGPAAATPSLPLAGALPLGNLPLVGSLTNLLHF